MTDRDHRTPRYVENGVPLISPRDFINAGIDFSDLKSVDKTEFQAFKKKCNPEKGDILYSRIRTIGEARLLNFDFDFVALHSIALIKPLSKTLDSKYVYYLLQTPDVRSQARHNVKSVGTPDLGLKRIKEFDVPLAPFPQQQLIVAEIEKQFSRLDEAIAGLKHIKANLKRYKASVLKAAVEGKLTEEWRLSARKRAQVDELEGIPKAQAGKWFVYIIECDNGSFYVGHTSDLHARWKAHCEEKAADWTRQYPPKYLIHYEELNSQPEAVKREKDLKTGYGRTWRKREIAAGRMKPIVHNPDNETGQPVHGVQTGAQLLKRILVERKKKWEEKNPGKKYKEPAAPDTSNLPELPEGWVWATFEQVSLRVTVGHVGPMKDEYVASGIPFLRSQNVRENKFETEGLKFVSPEFHRKLNKSSLHPGDIVVVRSGSVGVSCVIPATLKEANCSDLVIVKQPFAILSQYGAFYMNAITNTRVAAKRVGVALTHFNTQSMAAMSVPVPPLSEQKKIVDEVDSCLSVAEEIEATVDANLKRAERLRQGILRKAFSVGLLFAEVIGTECRERPRKA